MSFLRSVFSMPVLAGVGFSRLRAVLVAILLAMPVAVSAQGADIITGKIIGTDGVPVVGARVLVMSVETEITRSVLTGKDGRYMLNFPDGGGRYVMRVSFIGMAEAVQTVLREGDEELLLTNITLQPQAIQMATLEVTATRPPPGRGQTAEQSTELPQEMLNRLPLPDLDPNTLALLAAGVVGTGLDSLSGRMGFSVAGMSDLLNQIVIDGMIVGDGGLQIAEEGIRRTQVTTSTFDASRGGFAGGQVSMSTARGNNRTAGRLSYTFDDDGMQWASAPTTTGFTRHNLGGTIGGPVLRNKLFYNGNFQLTRNTNHRFSLSADDPNGELRSGVASDSVARFINILGNGYGIPTGNSTGQYSQFTDNVRLGGRIDWNIFQRQGQSQTLTAGFNYSLNNQDSTRINVTDITDHGGETDQNSRSANVSLNSRFGANWTNGLRASFNENWNDALPYIEMPEGMVRVTSDFEDGTRGTRNLVFGGNRGLPQESYSKDLQLSDDLSFLLPVGNQLHRLKVGGSIQKSRSINRSTNNIFGSFTYNSLADFEANNPERFDRSLTERRTNTTTFNTGIYFGDTWRINQPLEVTLGLRWDRTAIDQKPTFNPVIEQVFGRRNDIDPVVTGWSPRVGFNYRIPSGAPGAPARTLSGGIGVFAGRPQTNVFSTAVRQTGLPNAEQSLNCIGDAVPIPDWDLYMSDPDAIPSLCADGGPGLPPVFSSRAPSVTLINPDQTMPSSMRIDLGYRTRLPFNLNTNIRYNYSHGYGLWGSRDLNLNETPKFTLPDGRPVFASPAAITPGGSVAIAGSRLHPEFSQVNDVVADRASDTHQLTTQINGFLPFALTASVNYTLGFSRDQGGSSTGLVQTAGNPNERVWATASNDRRHTLNLSLTRAFSQEIELTAISRISSGSPFTPVVNRDINGDGAGRNDIAFIFDPRTTGDTAIANSMGRMLENVPGRVADCLESQFGKIAERNSCRNGWSQSLDLRANFRPNLPQVGLGRRMTLSLSASNVLNGLDQLFNGAENLRGWGESNNADATLLEVRGFDAATNSFSYQVNEGFGQTRRGTRRSAFTLNLSGRIAIGGQPFQSNRGFGQQGMMIAAGLGGGPGGGGGREGGAGGGGLGDLGPLLRAGANANIDSLITAVVLPNPVLGVIALKDSLKLLPEQVTKLDALATTLTTQLEPRREALAKAAKDLDLPSLAAQVNQGQSGGAGGRGGFGGGGDRGGRGGGGGGGGGNLAQNIDPRIMQRIALEVSPAIEGGRRDVTATMAQVQQTLSAEQWNRVPQRLRNTGGGRGGRGGGGGFNAVGIIDRMLVNPIPVLLSLKDTLKLTPEQVTKIEAISATVTEKLNKSRTDLGRRFEGVAPDQQGRIYQELQPQMNAARKEVTDALKEIEKIMTGDQWKQVPDRIKNPFQNQQTPGGGRRGGGTGTP